MRKEYWEWDTEEARRNGDANGLGDPNQVIISRACDKVEELEARCQRYREALEKIRDTPSTSFTLGLAQRAAREALRETD